MLTTLVSTTDKLQLVTDSSATLDVLVTFTDRVKSTKVWLETDRKLTAISSATTTDICVAPASTETRAINTIFITNYHASLSANVYVQYNANATLNRQPLFLLAPGECLEWVEYLGWFKLAAASSGYGDVIERILDATQAGTNGTAAQNWFPTSGAPNLEASTVYEFEGHLNMNRAAGTTSHTTSLLFGGTATLTYILWRAHCNTGDTLANAAENHAAGRSASAVVVKAASTSATEETSIIVKGAVKINAAGTFIPQFSYSAAPGGAPTIQIGSRFKLIKKGVGFNTKGTWS